MTVFILYVIVYVAELHAGYYVPWSVVSMVSSPTPYRV